MMKTMMMLWVVIGADAQRGVLTYQNVSAAVQRIEVFEWREGLMPTAVPATVDRAGGAVTIRARQSTNAIVMFFRSDGAYLLDGPLRWPDEPAERIVDTRWRRSIAIDVPPRAAVAEDIEWLSAASDDAGAWPRCVTMGARISCLGVPLGDSGVALQNAPGRLWWSVVTNTATPFRSSQWGRLLLVRGVSSDASPGAPVRPLVRVAIQYPVASPQRVRNVRLETGDVPGAKASPVADAAFWISGGDVPDQAWVDVRGVRAAPVYLPLRDVADGPSSLPVQIVVEEARSLEGAVLGDRGVPAAAAAITVFRMLDSSRGTTRDRDPPKRVFVSEATTDEGGRFRIDGLGQARYEIVAWHPQFGRASVAIVEEASRIVVQLRSDGVIRGRVVVGGKAVSGVDVSGVADPVAARAAEDLLDVKGGDTHTGADGRFAVFIPAGGELRVGGGRHPVRRIALPPGAAGSIDVGDIELGAPIAIFAVLNDDPDCALHATGPIGRSGLQVVPGVHAAPGIFRVAIPEPGFWEFGLTCGAAERGLSPTVMEIGVGLSGKEVRFMVR
jgi:hypothetical protein